MKPPTLADLHALPGAERTPAIIVDELRKSAEKIDKIICVIEYDSGECEIRVSDMSFADTNLLAKFLDWALSAAWHFCPGGKCE